MGDTGKILHAYYYKGFIFINPSTGWLVGWQAEEISHSTEFQTP